MTFFPDDGGEDDVLACSAYQEVFHTSYPEDVKIVHLRNEHQLEEGELITDARLLIGDKVYHIECQSTDDATMAIRMFEYDLAIALESRRRVGRRFFCGVSQVLCDLFENYEEYAGC